MDVQHQQTMAQLHQKVNPSERVVGWVSTGSDVSSSDALIHAFYAQECTNPVGAPYGWSRVVTATGDAHNWGRLSPR